MNIQPLSEAMKRRRRRHKLMKPNMVLVERDRLKALLEMEKKLDCWLNSMKKKLS